MTSFVSVPGFMPGLTTNPQDDLPLLRNLTLSGELLPPDTVELWTRGGYRRVTNNYGPTEASIEFCAVSCVGGEVVSVGAPRYNGHVYILDHDHTRVEKSSKILALPTVKRGRRISPRFAVGRKAPPGCTAKRGEATMIA